MRDVAPDPAIQYHPRDAITAVVLARLTGQLSIFPTAFYMTVLHVLYTGCR